jgi:hypothetical protein
MGFGLWPQNADGPPLGTARSAERLAGKLAAKPGRRGELRPDEPTRPPTHSLSVVGSDHAALRRALRTGDYASACTYARSLAVVPLDAALDLTLLAAEKDPDRYEDMARRWLVRWMEETEPGLAEIALAIVHLRPRKKPPPHEGTTAQDNMHQVRGMKIRKAPHLSVGPDSDARANPGV